MWLTVSRGVKKCCQETSSGGDGDGDDNNENGDVNGSHS